MRNNTEKAQDELANGHKYFGIRNELSSNTKLFRARMCLSTSVVFLDIIHRPWTTDNVQKSIAVLVYRRHELLNPMYVFISSSLEDFTNCMN
jgi:hypothetical protein